MVGLIQTILLDMIGNLGGTEATAAVRTNAGVEKNREFHIDENYDDAEFGRLLNAACEQLGVTQQQAETAFARAFYQDSLKRWPTWFQMSKTAREFLKRQPAIHNGFATGVSDPEARSAIRDKFKLEETDDRLIVHYRSPNRLCGVYIELAKLILEHYGEQAEIQQSSCMHRGDEKCEIHVIWNQG